MYDARSPVRGDRYRLVCTTRINNEHPAPQSEQTVQARG
jgi:hypothetical protein